MPELTIPAHWGRCVKKGRYLIGFSCVAQRGPSSQSCRWMWTIVAGCPMTSCRESAVSSRLGSAPALDVAWLVLLSSILIIFGSYHSRKHRVRVPLDHLLIVAMKTEIQVIPWDKRYQCSLTLWLLMHENYSSTPKSTKKRDLANIWYWYRTLSDVYFRWPIFRPAGNKALCLWINLLLESLIWLDMAGSWRK